MSLRKQINITPLSQGYYDRGVWIEGAPQPVIQIMGSVQPLNNTEIDLIPEGRRNNKAFKIYSDTELTQLGLNQSPDIFEFDGEKYELISKIPWGNDIINHYKYVFSKIDEL
jgi:hypothetical protein